MSRPLRWRLAGIAYRAAGWWFDLADWLMTPLVPDMSPDAVARLTARIEAEVARGEAEAATGDSSPAREQLSYTRRVRDGNVGRRRKNGVILTSEGKEDARHDP